MLHTFLRTAFRTRTPTCKDISTGERIMHAKALQKKNLWHDVLKAVGGGKDEMEAMAP